MTNHRIDRHRYSIGRIKPLESIKKMTGVNKIAHSKIGEAPRSEYLNQCSNQESEKEVVL